MTSSLASVRVLVLNASYEPVRIVSWQRAFLLGFAEKVEVLEHYGDVFVHSVSQAFPVPSVIRMTRYGFPTRLRRRVRFSRSHVFARDSFMCQYCSRELIEKELTLDHVVPVVLGGRTTWSNIVTCCTKCNQKKGAKTPQEVGFTLRRTPKEPQTGFLPDLVYYHEGSLPEAWKPFVNLELLRSA